MTLSLTLMGRETDALWRERITAGEGGILLDFSAPIDAGYTEIYPLNVWGWRRWLRKRNVERISWYEPDGVSWPVVWAAQWEKIPVDVHLTSARAVKWLRKRRWFLRRKIHYIPSALGWDAGAGNVHVRPLHPNAGKLQGERITQIKNFLDIKRVKNDTTPRPLRLLAVSRPGEKGLRLAVWTASMVRYVVGSVQLVIAGRVTPEQQQRIATWEKMWDSEGLCCLTKEAFSWEELMAICDMVLASGPRLEGLIRLVYAQAAEKHIIALRSECMELLVPNDHVHFVDRPCARELSRAVLGVIREDSLAAMSGVTA